LKNPVEGLAILLGIHKLPRSNIHLKPGSPGKYVVVSHLPAINVIVSSSGSASFISTFLPVDKYIASLPFFVDQGAFAISTSKIYDPDLSFFCLLINFIVNISKFWDLSVIFYFFNFYVSGIVTFVRTEAILRQCVV
jgi:hypothetical protein